MPSPVRRVGLERFHVLGWQSFLDVATLFHLNGTSTEFKEETEKHLLRGLRRSVGARHLSEGTQIKQIWALARRSKNGDPESIEALAPHLAADSYARRQAAIGALRQLAARGHECVVRHIEALLEDGKHPQIAAIRAMGLLATRGDPVAVTRVISYLRNNDLEVRMAATDTLRKLAKKGDAAAIAQVGEILREPVESQCEAARIALVHLFVPGDAHAITVVRQGLVVDNCQVRRAAVQTLQWMLLTKGGNSEIHGEVVEALRTVAENDESDMVRAAATLSLGEVACCHDAAVRKVLVARLREDESPEVRRSSVVALERLSVAAGDSAEVATVLRATLTDDATAVKAAGVAAVARLVEDADAELALAIVTCMKGDTQAVRLAGTAAAGQLIGRGSNAMVCAALQVLRDSAGKEEPLRDAASIALQQLPSHLKWVLSTRWTGGIELPISPVGRKVPCAVEVAEASSAVRRSHRKRVIL